MRATEFITEDIELSHEPTSTGGVQVSAYIDGKEAGWVRFTKLKTGQVKAAMVHVPERLRRQGIGSAMYKYARHELGLDIVPSDSQTQDGKAFWNKIHEAFDNPYAFNWSRGDHGDYDVFVKLPDGSPLSIAFNHEDEDTWHVAFDRGHSQEITGEGDAQRIFATVLHSIKQFIGKQHPDRLYFSASKEVEPGQNSESRANLYSRMVKRYASAWGYDSVVDDFGRDNVTYILNKKQPVTEEEFNGIDIDMDIEGDEIMVTAMGNGRELGHVLFVDEGEYLMPQDLEVDERFQGQGIAAAMYDYVKSKGYKIRRSGQQTDAGAGFWGKHRPEQNVWEGVNRSGVDLEVTELPDEDQILITATSHGKTLGRVYFDIFDSQLVAADAEVASEYRGQGIAAIIYDYAKELGWEVVRSGRQTDAGAGFWDKHRPKQDVWESTADDINKMFNNMYDPMTTNLQRVALMAMQGRQDEAVMQLNRVIKDASPEAQKKITDAVNNIKPVTVNGKVADSSTLDKSKKHQEWILNTFIPWVQSLLDKQDMTEEQQSTPTMGINVRSDGNIDYASLIIDGKKKYESRQTDSLRPYVGKTVAIVRTGKGSAVAIGQVTVGEPVVVDAEKFDKMRKLHLVPQGSKFDIGPDATKYLYPMINPVRWDNEKLVKQKGIVARKIN
jgi:predicted GNAT family acetyltransferase